MNKYYIIAIVSISLIGFGNHFYQKNQYNNIIDKVKSDFEKEKKLALKDKDKVIVSRDEIINQLTKDNEKAKADSKYWYNISKKKSINPDYNIDFITAADEISRSSYKPGKTNINNISK